MNMLPHSKIDDDDYSVTSEVIYQVFDWATTSIHMPGEDTKLTAFGLALGANGEVSLAAEINSCGKNEKLGEVNFTKHQLNLHLPKSELEALRIKPSAYATIIVHYQSYDSEGVHMDNPFNITRIIFTSKNMSKVGKRARKILPEKWLHQADK